MSAKKKRNQSNESQKEGRGSNRKKAGDAENADPRAAVARVEDNSKKFELPPWLSLTAAICGLVLTIGNILFFYFKYKDAVDKSRLAKARVEVMYYEVNANGLLFNYFTKQQSTESYASHPVFGSPIVNTSALDFAKDEDKVRRSIKSMLDGIRNEKHVEKDRIPSVDEVLWRTEVAFLSVQNCGGRRMENVSLRCYQIPQLKLGGFEVLAGEDFNSLLTHHPSAGSIAYRLPDLDPGDRVLLPIYCQAHHGTPGASATGAVLSDLLIPHVIEFDDFVDNDRKSEPLRGMMENSIFIRAGIEGRG